ncbi:unnamed protein product, partial [Meganyctiphanes norvegica]
MPLTNTTTGADILEAVLKCFNCYELDLSKLVSITTDGAPAMVGKNKGFVALLEKHMSAAGYQNKIIKLHCIIHQEALCAKNAEIKEVMQVVVKIVNYILSQGLNHRDFRSLMEELNAEHPDVKYFCDVRWLSRGATLQRFYDLLEEIDMFLAMKDQHYPQLKDSAWTSNLGFLVDITQKLNVLNLS